MKRPNRYALSIGIFALGLGLMVVVAGRGQGPALAAKDLEQLIEHDAKAIQAILAKPKLDKKGQAKVKAAAMMIAAYAQTAAAKDNGLKYHALRDQALKLIKAADTGKADEAKKLAAELSVNIKVDPATKAGPVALEKHLDLLSIMKQFSAERFGGFALEKAIEDLVEAQGPVDDKEVARIAILARKVSLIGHLAKSYPPEADVGTKTKKTWQELATQMETLALELAQTAQGRKAPEIGKAADRLSQNCVKCHDIFRVVQ